MVSNKPLPLAISTWDFGLKPAEAACRFVSEGIPALEAIEKAIWIAEDDPLVTSVGYGGMPTVDGYVELDASIFDGPRNLTGSVTSLRGIRHPISLARLVLEKTPHTMLCGSGALEFALRNGFEQENLLTEEARQRWEEWKRMPSPPEYPEKPFYLGHDTICLLLRDSNHNLYGGCSTSGLAWKMSGRIGDTPLIGSGLYLDNEVGAAAATGVGELAMSECASFAVVDLMRNSYDPEEACQLVLWRVLKKTYFQAPRQLALIALRKDGKIGAACLLKGFQAAVAMDGKSQLKDVEPMAFLEAKAQKREF